MSNLNIFPERKQRYTYMCADIYVQGDKKIKQISKQERKGVQFIPKMNNQRAHTEADKERGGTV